MDPLSRLAGLAIVFGLLALFAWAARRSPEGFRWPKWGRRAAAETRELAGEASLLLAPQHRLHVVRWREHRFLVLTAPGGGTIVSLESASSFLPAFTEALGSAQDDRKEQA